jgi:hypothetical protein
MLPVQAACSGCAALHADRPAAWYARGVKPADFNTGRHLLHCDDGIKLISHLTQCIVLVWSSNNVHALGDNCGGLAALDLPITVCFL